MTKGGLWLNACIAALGIVAFAAAGRDGFKWMATDEADRANVCGAAVKRPVHQR